MFLLLCNMGSPNAKLRYTSKAADRSEDSVALNTTVCWCVKHTEKTCLFWILHRNMQSFAHPNFSLSTAPNSHFNFLLLYCLCQSLNIKWRSYTEFVAVCVCVDWRCWPLKVEARQFSQRSRRNSHSRWLERKNNYHRIKKASDMSYVFTFLQLTGLHVFLVCDGP